MASQTAAQSSEAGLHAAFAVKIGQTLASRFRIERLLGMGAMGIVYVAQDLELGQPVAVKLLRPEIASQPIAIARFRQEILLAQQVTSPHVVRIHDLFRDGELTLLAMDYVDGEGLDKLIERTGPLPVDQVVGLLRDVAKGLGAAHTRGIVHRDLKPANILIDAQGRALISDFGIALSVAGGGSVSPDGMIVGTPDYLSPEQARGDALDGRSDLYALGLVGYEALTGASPFIELAPAAALAMRLHGSPPDVRGLRTDTPAWLAQLLRRLLRPQRAHRLPDANALLLALETRRVETGWRHRKALTLAAISAGLLLLTLMYYWLVAHPPGPAAPAAVAPAPALPPR